MQLETLCGQPAIQSLSDILGNETVDKLENVRRHTKKGNHLAHFPNIAERLLEMKTAINS